MRGAVGHVDCPTPHAADTMGAGGRGAVGVEQTASICRSWTFQAATCRHPALFQHGNIADLRLGVVSGPAMASTMILMLEQLAVAMHNDAAPIGGKAF